MSMFSESEARVEPIAQLLQSHDMIQWYQPDYGGMLVRSEGWSGHISVWAQGPYEMLAVMSVLRSSVPHSPELLGYVNDLNLRAISYQVVVPHPDEFGLTHVVVRTNMPTASLGGESTTQEWAVLTAYWVLHAGDQLDAGFDDFGGEKAGDEIAAALAFALS